MSKLNNFLLLIICYLLSFIFGKANRTTFNPKKIVVFRSKPHVGDMVYVTPLFRAIKKTYPESRVILIGGGRVGEVIAHNPDIDEYIEYKNNFWQVIKRFRNEKIDFGCMANLGTTEGLALLYLGGVKSISVFESADTAKSFSYTQLKKLAITHPFSSGTYVPPLYMNLLNPIVANTGDTHFRLYYSNEAKQKISALFSDHGVGINDFIVGLAVGGSTEDRWWPAERFARVGKYLHEKYNAKLFLVGAGKDEKAISETLKYLGDIPAVNLLNQSLDEFKAFIAHSKLMIGNDSGPMVTADAFDVPNLVLVGPTDWREYHRPPGPFNRISASPDKKIESLSETLVLQELNIILTSLGINVK